MQCVGYITHNMAAFKARFSPSVVDVMFVLFLFSFLTIGSVAFTFFASYWASAGKKKKKAVL